MTSDERKVALEHTEWSDVKVNFSKYTALQIERDGPILRVWFDRPDQLNAVSRDVHGELVRAFENLLQHRSGLLPVVVVLPVDDEHLDLLVGGADRDRGGAEQNEC